jgi:pyrimidine-specific ribonucleoside hydrolase
MSSTLSLWAELGRRKVFRRARVFSRPQSAASAAVIVSLMMLPAGCERSAAIDATAQPYPLIIDTDVGVDDLMAIAFLLASPDVPIEAITIGTGLAHTGAGADNVLRLLALAGRDDIPVYVGRSTPLAGDRAFPDEWRALSDELPGVHLPNARRAAETRPAADFLADRLSSVQRPVAVLALGGLTNVAEAIGRSANGAAAVQRLVIMGGAVHVAGNLHEAGENENVTAEWNFHIDAEAARRVFASGLPIRLIPLDATDQVPLDRSYIDELQRARDAPLAGFVTQLLGIVAPFMDVGNYYAWDPLAAVTLVDSSLVRAQPMSISIHVQPPEDGRSAAVPDGAPNADVAIEADARRFREIFVRTLTASPGEA